MAGDPTVVQADWDVLLVGLVFGAIAALIAVMLGGVRAYATSSAGGRGLPATPKFSFSDSWASDLAALAAAFATAVTAFEGINGMVSPEVAGPFAVTSAVLLALAACAPIAYTALASTAGGGPQGSLTGLLLSSFLTVGAACGGLGAVGVFASSGLDVSSPWDIIGWVVVVLVALLVVAYAARSIRWQLEEAALPEPPDDDTARRQEARYVSVVHGPAPQRRAVLL